MSTSVAQSAQRSVSPSTSVSSQPVQQQQKSQQTAAAQRPSVPGSRDEFVSGSASASASAQARSSNPPNRTATVDSVSKEGARNQMTTGRITINGNTYTYRSGGHDRGNLPNGEYTVTPHLWSRNTKGMVVDGVGYSFALSDKYDPRVGGTRSLLRIHPDGGVAGTQGCIGIVGGADVQRRFREDMRAELARSGGSFTLRVGQ